MRLSRLSLVVVFVIAAVVAGRLAGNSNGETVGKSKPVTRETIEEQFQNSRAEVQQKPAKEEILEEFISTADISEIKQAYSSFTRDQIKLIQQQLNNKGYDSGKVDGIIGRITIQAIASFQYDQGFVITGVLLDGELEALGVTEVVHSEVSLLSVKLEYNHSVGHEWGYAFAVNGEEIQKGSSKKFYLAKDGSLVLEASATEFDKVPDHGSSRTVYRYEDYSGQQDDDQ